MGTFSKMKRVYGIEQKDARETASKATSGGTAKPSSGSFAAMKERYGIGTATSPVTTPAVTRPVQGGASTGNGLDEVVRANSAIAQTQRELSDIQAQIDEREAGLDLDGAAQIYNTTYAAKKRQLKEQEAALKQAMASTSTGAQLAQLKQRQSELTAGLDLDGASALQSEIDRLENQSKMEGYAGKVYADDFSGQFSASMAVGRLQQEEAKAWGNYASSPTQENRERAQAISTILTRVQNDNANTLDEDATVPLLSQSLAGYLPQFWDQTKARVGGATTGAALAAMTPWTAPFTVNAAKVGATAATGLQSYQVMRGRAFKDLLDLGVDEETARKAANDEGVISSMIEMAETGVDLFVGLGSLIKGGGKMVTEAAKPAAMKLLTLLGKYGLNMGTEWMEEGSQQGVSIANRENAAQGETGKGRLFGRTLGVLWDAATGKDKEAAQEIIAAGNEGAKIAAVMGLPGTAGNIAMSTIANRNPQTVTQEQTEGIPAVDVEAGTDQAHDVTPGAAVVGDDIPTAAGADIAGQLIAAGATQAEAETLAPILNSVLNGEEISGNQAGTIAKNEVAVSILENATGETINTDAPLGEVKSTIRGLASRHSAQAEQAATEDTPAQVQPVEAAQAPVESPVMESPTAEDFTQRNAQAVADFAKTVDKAGATVLTQMYTEGQATEQYIAGMMKAYHAGMTGGSLDSTRLTAGKIGVTSQQAEAAYMAGQADAKTSLAKQQRAAKYAKVAGTDSGLVFDDYVADTLNVTTAERVNSVAKLLGLRVRFVDSVRGGTANAQISGSEVLVERNNPNPVMFLLGHEWTHRLQELAPTEYRAFRNAVAEEVQGEARDLLEHYRRAGENISYEEALDEAAANYAGRMIEDSTLLDQFIEKHKDNRTMLKKVRDAIRTLISKLTGAERRAAQTAEGKLTAALEAAAVQAGTLQAGADGDTMGVTRNSLKEDLENGRARKEAREAFLQRAAGAGYAVYEGKTAAYGYRNVRGRSAKGNARQVQEEVKKLGIDAEIIDGPLLWNRDGITGTREVQQAVTVDRARIFINNAATISPRNIAGHEAFHLWRSGTGRDAYIETVEDNLLFTSEAFREYQSSIAEAYLGGEADLTNDAQMKKLREELFAYISGDIHEGVNDDLLRPVFRDFDAVKAAWNELVAQNGPRNYSLKGSESREAMERYKALIDKYGAIPPGENPTRDIQVPKKTADNQKVSQTVRTILEANATPDTAVPTIEELTAMGDFSYEVYTDKQAMADADNTIRDKGYNTALMEWTKSVQEGEVSKRNTALGWVLYNQAANAGDLKTAMSILTNMVGHQRNAAQAVQATRILKKMSPEAQLYGVQRSAQNLAEELEKRYGKDAPDIRVNEELARKYLEAETDKEREEAMRNLYRDLGRQMPSRFIDKWNAWRYLSMLGNPRTHVRNVLGNAFFAPVVFAKDMTATAIESAVSRVSGGKLDRTKGAVGFDRKSRDLLRAAWSDYEFVADQVSSGGKYSDLDHSNQYIQEGRRIFKNRALEAARKGNSAALEAEDMWFSRPHYAYALAQYCKAHGISPEMLRAANGGQKKTATDGGQEKYSVKGNPYAGKNLSDDPSVYTWDFLTSLPDMKTVTLPEVPSIRDKSGRVDTSKVVTAGMRNARNMGTEQDGKVFVRNAYTGKNLMVTTNSIRHGLNGANNRLLTNARLGAVIGEVVKNAVPINALNDKAADVIGTYAMASYATDSKGREFVAIVTVEQKSGRVAAVEAYDMLHAVSGRQKKSSQADTKSQSINSIKAATISIADLLKIVKETHQSILSGDVLAYFGEERNPNGDYAGKVKFSLATAERPALQTKAPFVDRILLDRARAYAIKEAQKATYRDTNAFSQTISELGRYRGNNKVKKGVGVALEGILPFRKTPANILVRGLEYSPLGLGNGIKQAVWDVKRGNKTAAEAIDSISAGLTGTGLLALGAFLAAQGLVRGSGGDDEEKNEFEELQGHQAYALELPDGTSVTLDWLAPEVLPFFVGVNLWEQTVSKDDGGVTMSDILTATANVTEPLLEMSCLQSLNDVFDAVGYASSDGLSALPSALASAATSYLTQGFPTILGQAERTGEDKRMTTYTEKNAFLTPDMQYTVGRISARLPGLDYQQIPYIDAWGRTENTGNAAERAGNNFLNPAYTSTVEISPMEDELLRLYEQTGEGSVLPSRAGKYFNVDGERKDLTAQEYVKYATAKGQTAYKVLTALSGSEAYRKMSDAEKVEVVGLVYDYANATAKTKVSGYKPEGWIAKAVKTEKATGVKAEQYVMLYLAQKDIESLKESDGDTIANSKSLLVMEMVYNVKGLTDAQRRALFEDFGVGKTVIHFNKAAVQEKLREMRKKTA